VDVAIYRQQMMGATHVETVGKLARRSRLAELRTSPFGSMFKTTK
jgi:hypothetical protein